MEAVIGEGPREKVFLIWHLGSNILDKDNKAHSVYSNFTGFVFFCESSDSVLLYELSAWMNS